MCPNFESSQLFCFDWLFHNLRHRHLLQMTKFSIKDENISMTRLDNEKATKATNKTQIRIQARFQFMVIRFYSTCWHGNRFEKTLKNDLFPEIIDSKGHKKKPLAVINNAFQILEHLQDFYHWYLHIKLIPIICFIPRCYIILLQMEENSRTYRIPEISVFIQHCH